MEESVTLTGERDSHSYSSLLLSELVVSFSEVPAIIFSCPSKQSTDLAIQSVKGSAFADSGCSFLAGVQVFLDFLRECMMEASVEGSDDLLTVSSPAPTSSSSSGRRFGVQFPALDFLRSPLSVILEYSGIVPPTRSQDPAHPPLLNDDPVQAHLPNCPPADDVSARGEGEVSIRIIGATEGSYVSCSIWLFASSIIPNLYMVQQFDNGLLPISG